MRPLVLLAVLAVVAFGAWMTGPRPVEELVVEGRLSWLFEEPDVPPARQRFVGMILESAGSDPLILVPLELDPWRLAEGSELTVWVRREPTTMQSSGYYLVATRIEARRAPPPREQA